MKLVLPALITAAALSLASGAHAAESWLACKGTMSVTPHNAKAPTSTTPSDRVLVFNDEIKRIYQWLEARKQMSPLPEKVYTDKEITWDVSDRATAGSYWKGKLDRGTMAVTIEYTEGDLTKTIWNEACASTPARDKAAMADADTSVTKTN
jgi:hypothetical protein